ncbi:MAG TPA: type II toxin-antitoxin system HicB family antitoxin [Candidatus Paceibacterota bacterium]
MKKVTKRYNLPVVVERDRHGYFAYCPELQGCYTQGDTYEEVFKNISDAILLHIKDRRGERMELPSLVSLSTIEVAA